MYTLTNITGRPSTVAVRTSQAINIDGTIVRPEQSYNFEAPTPDVLENMELRRISVCEGSRPVRSIHDFDGFSVEKRSRRQVVQEGPRSRVSRKLEYVIAEELEGEEEESEASEDAFVSEETPAKAKEETPEEEAPEEEAPEEEVLEEDTAEEEAEEEGAAEEGAAEEEAAEMPFDAPSTDGNADEAIEYLRSTDTSDWTEEVWGAYLEGETRKTVLRAAKDAIDA